jgi:AraC family ethanolamine operon transcriptional activator
MYGWLRSENRGPDPRHRSQRQQESFESVSSAGFACFAVSVSEEVLERAAASLGLPDPTDLLGSVPQVVACNPEMLAGVHQGLMEVEGVLRGDPSASHLLAIQRELDTELPLRLLEAAASARATSDRSSSRERQRILKSALEYLRAHTRDAPTVQDLCAVARCNERTLRRAFLQRFGMPPRAYVKAARLNGVRRDLRSGDSGDPDVANA